VGDGDRDALQQRVDAHAYWYHRIALPHGVTTPGWAPLNPEAYGVPERLDGLRVLDVGAWDGFWSFEALRRGAREVVAIDDFSDALGLLDGDARERSGWGTFDLCRDAFGYSEAVCRRETLSVYDVSEDTLGRFDLVFCFGVLYHLRYPLLGLDRLASVCDRALYVESAILDDFSPYRGGLGHGYPDRNQVVAEFYPDDQYGQNPSNWWVPTLSALGALVRAAGFPRVHGWKLTQEPATTLPQCRGFVVGTRA